MDTVSIKPRAYPSLIAIGFVIYIWFFVWLLWQDGVIQLKLTPEWIGGSIASVILLVAFGFVYVKSRSLELRYEQELLTFRKQDVIKSVRVDELSDIVCFLMGARVGTNVGAGLFYIVFSEKGSTEPEIWLLGNVGFDQWPVLRVEALIKGIQTDLKANGLSHFPLQDAVGPALPSIAPSMEFHRVITSDTKKFFQEALRK